MLEAILQGRRYLYSKMIAFGFGFTLLGSYAAYQYIQLQGALMAVILVSLAASYPLVQFMRAEEHREERKIRKVSEGHILKRHGREVTVYFVFFLAVAIGFALVAQFIPSEFFAPQNKTIGAITGNVFEEGFFATILSNNLQVFLLTFVLSFFIAATMVFVLVWNASIFGVFIQQNISHFLHAPGFIAMYLPHGIFEIGAYVLAGLSGALLSHEFEHLHDAKYRKHVFPYVLRDVLLVFSIGIISVMAGAFIETL